MITAGSSEDIAVGDADGVVIVPAGYAKEAAEICRKIEQTEDNIRNAFLGGMPLKEARQKFGYFEIKATGARNERVVAQNLGTCGKAGGREPL